MSPREINDVIDSRIKQRNKEIYMLSGMIRTAIVSAFNTSVKFPKAPDEEEGDWRRSKAYFDALYKAQGGGAK